MPTLDTGRSVGAGAFEVGGGAAVGNFDRATLGGPNDPSDPNDPGGPNDPGNLEEEGISSVVSPLVPVMELSGAYGVGPRTDVGVRFDTAFFTALRVKHQVLGTRTSPFAASIGLEAGGHLMALLAGGVGYGYASAPLTLSYHPREALAVYAAPRYTVVTASQLLPAPPRSSSRGGAVWGVPGLTYGVAYGRRVRLAAEVSHVDGPAPVQLALGLRLRVN